MAKFCVMADWDDVPHLSEAQKKELWDAIPPHERKSRAQGIPMMGSGLIFPVDPDEIRVESFNIPRHWPQINGLDFGWDHPFAAVNLAWDRDHDRVYVCKTYRQSEATPIIHSASIKPWGEWVPCAWPHDGYQHDKGSGDQLKEQYTAQGLNMLQEHATHPEGGFGVEAGLMDMLDRMQTDRFKVFSENNDWFSEMSMYHRKDGKIVKERDDLMSATRIGLMMIRYAAVRSIGTRRKPRRIGMA